MNVDHYRGSRLDGAISRLTGGRFGVRTDIRYPGTFLIGENGERLYCVATTRMKQRLVRNRPGEKKSGRV